MVVPACTTSILPKEIFIKYALRSLLHLNDSMRHDAFFVSYIEVLQCNHAADYSVVTVLSLAICSEKDIFLRWEQSRTPKNVHMLELHMRHDGQRYVIII